MINNQQSDVFLRPYSVTLEFINHQNYQLLTIDCSQL